MPSCASARSSRNRLATRILRTMLRIVSESSTTSTRLGSRSRAQRSISVLACSTSAGLTTTLSAPASARPCASSMLAATRNTNGFCSIDRACAMQRARSAAGMAASIKMASILLAVILARAAAALSASTISTGTDATPAPRRIRSRSAAEAEHSRTRREMRSPSIMLAAKIPPRHRAARTQVVQRMEVRNRVGGYAAGIVSRKRTASPPDGVANSPSHITCDPRTNVPTGHPVTVTPS